MALRLLVCSKLQLQNRCSNKIISRVIAHSQVCSNFSTSPIINSDLPNEGKLLIDGINLHWEKFGDGPHVALCLPGLVGSIQTNFLRVAKKMDLDTFTLIAWDPPGYGKSRPPDREIFTEEWCLARDARLAALLMKELGYTKYSTIGWSNGGATGAFIAASFPDVVHKVVMCNTPRRFDERSKKVMQLMIDLDTWKPVHRRALLSVYDKEYAVKMLMDWKKFCEIEVGKQAFSRYLVGEMKKVQAPVLFMQGVEDIVATMQDAEGYGKLIPNFKLHKVPKGGHDHLEFLDEFVSTTEEFLNGK